MRIIDTHCHPQFPHYDQDREAVVARAREAGVGMICVGTDFETSRLAVELAQRYPDIWASVGLHPNDNLGEVYDQDLYEKLASDRRVIAIGEVGLDYYRTTEPDKKKTQRERFERQIELAVKLGKPLIIHCRDGSTSPTTRAHEDMISILESLSFPPKGVIHSFTGTWDDAERYIALGWYLGCNGITTFARQYDEVITRIPVDNILLETDAPYLAPVPHRGKRNEPGYVIEVARHIALLRNMDLDEFLHATLKNSLNLFNLSL